MVRFASLAATLAAASVLGCAPIDAHDPDGGAADAYREPEDAGPPRAIFSLPRGEGADFFDLPWPSDLRTTSSGTIDVTDFPNPRSIDLMDRYTATVTARQRGFSTNGSIYFRFSRELDPASLPRTAEESLAPAAAVFLLDVDANSPERLTRHPITTTFQRADALYWSSRTLALTVVHGIPLAPGRRYAAVVTRAVRTLDGSALERDEDFAALIDGGGDGEVERARAVYRPALDAVLEAGTAEDDILALAVFTTQDPVGDLTLFRDWMRAQPSLEPSAEPTAWRLIAERPAYEHVEGIYGPVPVFQDGVIPYEREGGIMEPGADGVPLVRGEIDVRFAMTVPTSAMPPAGYPIVIYAHGTGGDYRSFLDDGTGARLAAVGIATIGLDLIHHGERNPSSASPDLLFVNVLNPNAARDNIRQSALDFVQTARFVRTAAIPASVATRGGATIRFDGERVYFFGHSQGALIAPIYMAIDDGVEGGVISAGGAVIAYALLEKEEPIPIPELLRVTLALPGGTREEAFEREGFGFPHPVVTLLQGWIDGADPANFGRLVFAAPRETFAPKSVLSTEGTADPYSPPGAIEALAVSMRVPPVSPIVRRVPAYDVLGIGEVPAPVSANVAGRLATAGLVQYEGGDHWVALSDRPARARIVGFFQSFVSSGIPTIPAP